jgi:cellulose synthase/poly-beta-1,6-N-acetylglucosamine synthase-like glycosyltransferase
MTQLEQEMDGAAANAVVTRADRPRPTGQRQEGRRLGLERPSRGLVTAGLAVAVVAVIAAARAAGIGPDPLWWPAAAVASVTAIYLAVILFKLLMICFGSTETARLDAPEVLPARWTEEALPRYTVLAPLSGPDVTDGQSDRLIADLAALDYPASRLEVLLLVAADGEGPAEPLPDHFTVVSVGSADPHQARAAGLVRASGELCVDYRPGQRPDVGQLRASAAAFQQLPDWVVSVQAPVRCQNPDLNWLSRCVAAEQSVNSVLLLRGLDKFRLVLPFGGASAHFRTDALRQLGAWRADDPRGDGDLGTRIARRGWGVRLLASVTTEEADGRLGPWLGDRAASFRDGYRNWQAQVRSSYRLWRNLGPTRFAALQLTSALGVCTALANPLFWLLTVAWLVGGSGGPVAGVFPLPELSVVVAAMLLGNVLTAYSLMIGCMEQGMFPAVRTMFLAPVYWALTSMAAYRALLPRSPMTRTPAIVPSIAAS